MPRKIIHLDLDAFFCAVEEQRDPSLRGKPFAVGGRPDQRGVVASCSYAARQFGVRSAMPMARALRLCPKLIIVGGHYKDYRDASHKVMEVMRRLTPLVEQISIDEAFIDLSEQPEDAETLAHRLQAEINDTLGLPCSLGVATNKLVAKIATDTGKAASLKRTGTPSPPNAITVVPPGQEAEFLDPLPAQALWGVGPKTAERLAEIGIHTIGDIANWPEADLIRRFGKSGAELSRHAHGISESPIITEHEAKSISQETTFTRDIKDPERLRQVLRELVGQVGGQLRKSSLKGRTVKLKLRWHDFTTLTRQTTLPSPTDQDDVICRAVLELFEMVWQTPRPVRLLGVGVSHFDSPTPIKQLSLWDVEPADRQRLRQVLDELQECYGKTTIRRGSELRKP